MYDRLGKSLRSIIKQYSPEAAESSTGKKLHLSITAYMMHILDDLKAIMFGFYLFFKLSALVCTQDIVIKLDICLLVEFAHINQFWFV
jgi:hypothetical protein